MNMIHLVMHANNIVTVYLVMHVILHKYMWFKWDILWTYVLIYYT